MNESPKKRAVIVGLFVFLGFAFLIAGTLMVGNLNETFTNKMEIVAHFDDVGGLQKGNNVWFSGVKIGTVSSIDFHGKSQVEVHFKIDKKTQQYIRKDAMVKLSSDGLIGNKILVIYNGTDQFAQVEEGDTLVVEETFTSEDMINTLQENNVNMKSITEDFKTISSTLAAGQGTVGKLLADSSVYDNINAATASLQSAAKKADLLVGSLAVFSSNLNKKGTLANELTTDTVIFNSVKTTALQLQQIADSASLIVTNLKQASSNPNSTIGVLLHDEESGAYIKETIKNLESSSIKLDEGLEAAQHSFLLRRYFRDKEKAAKKEAEGK
jgi:phospholipid/cholesterol/gamma-HCH transport system substrate-binding protein